MGGPGSGLHKLTSSDKDGRSILHHNTAFIVTTLLDEFNAAAERKDTKTIVEIAGIMLPYTMPKLQAIAHITPSRAIETMEAFREFLVNKQQGLLPPGEHASEPIQNEAGRASEVKPISVVVVDPNKPFSELSKAEIIAKYHPRGGK